MSIEAEDCLNNRKLHVILDNLNTHKKNEHWLKAHPNVQFHFTPTSASWLNQVEVWFSILQGQSLSGTSFTSLKQLQDHIDAYVNAYHDKAQPFVWTKKKGPSTPIQRPTYHSTLIPGTGAKAGNLRFYAGGSPGSSPPERKAACVATSGPSLGRKRPMRAAIASDGGRGTPLLHNYLR